MSVIGKVKTSGRHGVRLLAFSALLCGAAPFPAQAQDMQGRITRLENEIQTLSRAVFKGDVPPGAFGAAPSDSAESRAAMQVKFSQMEAEIRTLTGKIEEQQFQIQRLQDAMDRQAAEMAAAASRASVATSAPMPTLTGSTAGTIPQPTPPLRVFAPDGSQVPNPVAQTNAAPADAPAPATNANPLGTLTQEGGQGALKATSGSATEVYEQAFTMLKGEDYAGAKAGFEDFLARFSDHTLAGNAKYWLGETYYVTGDYATAARTFAESYKLYPQGTKAPDSLLKLGMALGAQNQKDSACLTFNQLKTQYPTAESVLSRATQEAQKLGCVS